jgi:protein-disulfide isomerase
MGNVERANLKGRSRMRVVSRVRSMGAILASAGVLAAGAAPVAAQVTDTPRAGAATMVERALESRAKGDPTAEVVVFEVADFQCPYCAQFAATVGKELDRKYVETGRIQWVFVNLPLHTHRLAWVAAKAALCAGAAGGVFWPMHDRIFAEQPRWSRMDNPGPFFARIANELGADMPDYEACVAQDRVAPLILEDFGSAVSAGITGTPTFIVMKGDEVIERLVGVHSAQEWSRILDAALRP